MNFSLHSRVNLQGPAGSVRVDGLAPRLRLPLPLSVVLQRAASREGIWSELVKLRDEFRSVRERMRAERSTGALDGAIVQRLAYEISRELRHLGPSVDGVLAPASAIAGALPIDAAAASASLKIAATLRPIQQAQRALERLLKPELHVLRSFVAEAKAMVRIS